MFIKGVNQAAALLWLCVFEELSSFLNALELLLQLFRIENCFVYRYLYCIIQIIGQTFIDTKLLIYLIQIIFLFHEVI